MRRLLITTLVALAVLAGEASGASDCRPLPGVSFSSADKVRVTGTLRLEEHWGPPNFGEQPATDAKYKFWVLILDFPLTAMANGERVTTDRIQLEYLTQQQFRAFTRFKDKHIAATGSLLDTEIAATQVTPVQIADAQIVVSGAHERVECRN